MKNYKIAILGGGASGMLTAILSAEKIGGKNIAILESGERLGKKLSQTGNGRGNITNLASTTANFHGDNVDFVLSALPPQKAIELFAEMGIATTALGTKVFPRSLSASSFVDMLRYKIADLGVNVHLESKILSAKKSGEKFVISCENETFTAEKIVVAMGGSVAPHLGTNGSGGLLLQSFGHTEAPHHPALVQVKTTSKHTNRLKGLKAPVKATLFVGGKQLFSVSEEMHFSPFALSGPATFLLSAYSAPHKSGYVTVDFLEEISEAELVKMLKEKSKILSTHPSEVLLFTLVANQIARCVASEACVEGKTISQLENSDFEKIARTAKNFVFDFCGNLTKEKAQATLGGVRVTEFTNSLESKIVKNLFACGEVLNTCGDCGGHNLQFAWASGYVVAGGVTRS